MGVRKLDTGISSMSNSEDCLHDWNFTVIYLHDVILEGKYKE